MMQTKPRLICIDVDGTLVGSQGVHPRVWEAARQAKAQGLYLAICTGRPAMAETLSYAQQLAPQDWHIFQGGASIMKVDSGESVSRPLPPETIPELIALSRQQGWVLELYTDRDYVCEQADDGSEAGHLARSHAQLLGMAYQQRQFSELKDPIIRAQWVVSDAQMAAVMASETGALLYSAATSPAVPGSNFISITAPGVDKCSAISTLAERLEIPLAETMMVGDGQNDISAMALVGFPVAMGNGHPELKQVCRYSVGTADQGGLADALSLNFSL